MALSCGHCTRVQRLLSFSLKRIPQISSSTVLTCNAQLLQIRYLHFYKPVVSTTKCSLTRRTGTFSRLLSRNASSVTEVSEASVSVTKTIDGLVDFEIPPPPPVPDVTEPVSELVLNSLGEPTLYSLGLANPWTPVGWVQSILEALHVSLDMPWWSCIVLCTISLRLITFPLMIICRKNVAAMHNHSPHMVHLQEKLTAARMHGNNMEAAMIAVELGEFMKKNNINPFKNVVLPLAQAPFFLSMFFGLRRMASLPVASLATGGCLWFTDLTMADPFYALPVMTAVTLLAVVELGSDTGVRTQNLGHFKNFMRAMPFIFLPFTIHFPTAVLNYWLTNNAISLLQTALLKFKPVRQKLGIPELVAVPQLPGGKKKKKGFIKGMKESMSNARAISEIQDRERVSALKFKESGLGPIQKTFASDPTKLTRTKKTKVGVAAKPKT